MRVGEEHTPRVVIIRLIAANSRARRQPDDVADVPELRRKRPSSPQIIASASPRLSASAAITVVEVRTSVRAASGVMPRRPATSIIGRT
jgi:hypothetical protein